VPAGWLVALGASTGGTEAIAHILAGMPAESPPVLIAQHIPEMFSRSFSERVDKISRLVVREAEDGEIARNGHAYVAPGDRHLTVRRRGVEYVCVVDQAPAVNRHRPSVDVLFESVALAAAARGVGVMLTGMGSDGARGLSAMRRAGARTLAQDKATSVVWGMPGAAAELGAVERIAPLEHLAAAIVGCVGAGSAGTGSASVAAQAP
ncbi:MAG: CheB methylesterase domain-containing protein, partial [Pseudomonadota bacterium]